MPAESISPAPSAEVAPPPPPPARAAAATAFRELEKGAWPGYVRGVHALAWDEARHRVAVDFDDPGTFSVLELGAASPGRIIQTRTGYHTTGLLFSADGTAIHQASFRGQVFHFPLATGAMAAQPWEVHPNRFGSGFLGGLATDAQGRYIATGGLEGAVELFDAQGAPLFHLEMGRTPSTIKGVAMSPDAAWFALGYDDGHLEIRRIPDGTVLRTINAGALGTSGDFGHVSLATDPDGAYLALSASAGAILVYDIRSGALVSRLEDPDLNHHMDIVFGRGFIASNSLMVRDTRSWSKDNTSRVSFWDPWSGRKVQDLLPPSNEVPGKLARSKDGTEVLYASASGYRIWSVQ